MTARMGRPPYEDGRIIKGIGVRLLPAAVDELRALAAERKQSIALTAGQLIEEALALRATHD